MRIKTLKLVLIMAVVADIVALIIDYPAVYIGAFDLGFDTYNIVELVSRHIH